MKKAEKAAAVVGLVLLAGVVVWGSDTARGVAVDASADLSASVGELPPYPDYDAAHQHLCQPSTMSDFVHGRHPLYRRPKHAGHAKTMLATYGWAWLSNPPSEEG